MDDQQSDVVAYLASPATYGGVEVQRFSTHSAHVFLAGDRAYKLKRSVRLPFLDYSTPEKRRAALDVEFELNRRIAPSLYLHVMPICRKPSGDLGFAGGPVVDWVLVMKRFAQDALLDNLAAANLLTNEMIDALADGITAMHRKSAVIRTPPRTPFRTQVLDNIASMRGAEIDQCLVDELESDCERALADLDAHFQRRAAGGFVRHLHGDLHLGNIVLIDGKPTPFDALEFDSALATGDLYYDLAFLLMDLEHRDRGAMANRLLNRYVHLTDDIAGLRGLPLFLAVRAAIRAKVALLAGGKPLPPPARALAGQYLALATRYLPAGAPRIVGIGGPSGTGKSALAVALAPGEGPSPGAIVLRSDVVRKQLCGVAETTRLPPEFYGAATTEKVYTTLIERARRVIAAGRTVILDAVFAAESERAALAELASVERVPFRGIWLEAPLSVRRERVGARIKDASDAGTDVVNAQATYDIGALSWSRCDAGGSPSEVLAAARQVLSV